MAHCTLLFLNPAHISLSRLLNSYWLNLSECAVFWSWLIQSCMFVVVVQLVSPVRPFATPWTAACQVSLSFTISWSLFKLMSIELVMSSSHLILCWPFSSCLQSFPGSFLMSQFFASGGQSIGDSASVSVLPMNSQDWFPLGLTGLISLKSKELSRVFSNTTIQKH